MFTPIQGHPIPARQDVREKALEAEFPNEENEASTAALATIGGIGFLILMIGLLSQFEREVLGDSRLKLFCVFVIMFVLVAEVAGFGCLFNVFVMHEFRCYNRISPFISLFSFGAVAIGLDHLLNRKPAYFKCLAAILTLFMAAFDQIPTVFFQSHSGCEQRFYEDRQLIRKLESRLPHGSKVFQLPNTPFPLDPGCQRMTPYDHARAYLHSGNLPWSWGNIDGRNQDWAKNTAALPLTDMLQRVAFAGFGGILLDRFGYPVIARNYLPHARLLYRSTSSVSL